MQVSAKFSEFSPTFKYKMLFLLLNGPNLNLLGTREPDIYGADTLGDIETQTGQLLSSLGVELECFQSNAEHQLIERIHQAKKDQVDYILFNPAAFTHTSIALRDALTAVAIPFTEIHLSDPERREAFRHVSYFSDVAQEVIKGQGSQGYLIAAKNAVKTLQQAI